MIEPTRPTDTGILQPFMKKKLYILRHSRSQLRQDLPYWGICWRVADTGSGSGDQCYMEHAVVSSYSDLALEPLHNPGSLSLPDRVPLTTLSTCKWASKPSRALLCISTAPTKMAAEGHWKLQCPIGQLLPLVTPLEAEEEHHSPETPLPLQGIKAPSAGWNRNYTYTILKVVLQ